MMMNDKNLGQNVTVQSNFQTSQGSNTKWLRLTKNDFFTRSVECINLAHVSKVSYEKQRVVPLFKLGLVLCGVAWVFFFFMNWSVFGMFMASGCMAAILSHVFGKTECLLWLDSVHKVPMRDIMTKDQFEDFFDQLTDHMNASPQNSPLQNFNSQDNKSVQSEYERLTQVPQVPHMQSKYGPSIPPVKEIASEKPTSEKPSVSNVIRQRLSEKRESKQAESQGRIPWNDVRGQEDTAAKIGQAIFDQTIFDQTNIDQTNIEQTKTDVANIDLSLLNRIAKFGDLELPLNHIDLSDLELSDLERAKEVINQINNLQPSERNLIGTRDLWVKIGRVFQKYGEITFAESCYRTALSRDSKDARTWARLAYVVNDEKKRKQCLKLAVELDPTLTDEEL
jgi:tetratricopeptide (TPR) repeat protein